MTGGKLYLRFMSERISTSNAPKPVGLYPHARRVGNLLFLERRRATTPGRTRLERQRGARPGVGPQWQLQSV